jgi:hypothetical protein
LIDAPRTLSELWYLFVIQTEYPFVCQSNLGTDGLTPNNMGALPRSTFTEDETQSRFSKGLWPRFRDLWNTVGKVAQIADNKANFSQRGHTLALAHSDPLDHSDPDYTPFASSSTRFQDPWGPSKHTKVDPGAFWTVYNQNALHSAVPRSRVSLAQAGRPAGFFPWGYRPPRPPPSAPPFPPAPTTEAPLLPLPSPPNLPPSL